MKTMTRLGVLMCVVALAWALVPSQATAAFGPSVTSGGVTTWSDDANKSYFMRVDGSKSWYTNNAGLTSQWYYMGQTQYDNFIGDGSVHGFLDNPYWFGYFASGGVQYGYWGNNTAAYGGFTQFTYGYVAGQWYGGSSQWDKLSGLNAYQDNPASKGWDKLGAAGLNASFIGDGNYHDVGANWWYLSYGVCGYWIRDSTVSTPWFGYDYTTSQWYTGGAFGWATLGNPGQLGLRFMGDGSSHVLGVRFMGDVTSRVLSNNADAVHGAFTYRLTDGVGIWRNADLLGDGGRDQFRYTYGTGLWENQGAAGSGWYGIGGDATKGLGMDPTFIGDAQYHDILGTKFRFKFTLDDHGGAASWFNTALDTPRDQFRYTYGTGYWEHSDLANNWDSLGNLGLTASFVGDGNLHDLRDDWSFIAFDNGRRARWTNNRYMVTAKFEYEYVTGQWFHGGNFGLVPLGAAGLRTSFMGDLDEHTLGGGIYANFTYYYQSVLNDEIWDKGFWRNASLMGEIGVLGELQFSYAYSTGGWEHQRNDGEWNGIGGDVKKLGLGMDPTFIGDGQYHDIPGTTFRYKFTNDAKGGVALWYNTALWTPRDQFRYIYDAGIWESLDYGGARQYGPAAPPKRWWPLCKEANPTEFLGDSTRNHLLRGSVFFDLPFFWFGGKKTEARGCFYDQWLVLKETWYY